MQNQNNVGDNIQGAQKKLLGVLLGPILLEVNLNKHIVNLGVDWMPLYLQFYF